MKIVTELATTFRGLEYWTAVDDDTYDGPESPIGFGHSAEQAIDDLLEKMEDAE